jgi:hypothetical protein
MQDNQEKETSTDEVQVQENKKKRSKAKVCGRLLSRIAGSNPARRLDVCVV